jgi:hypothetical protein
VPTWVAAHSSDIRVVPLASGPAANGTSAQLLVGYFNAATVLTTLTEPINFQLALLGLDRLPFLSNAPQVHVKVEKIPNSGEAALPAPILLGEFNIARSGSTLMTYLTDLKAGEVYQLTLSKPR